MANSENPHCLDTKIIEQNGACTKVKSYLKGWHPELPNAVLTKGWTGPETIVEKTGVKPYRIFRVEEKK